MRAYAYIVFSSQVQARSSVVGDSVPAVDAQQVFKDTFKARVNEYYFISTDIDRYKGVLEHALSEVRF